MSFALQSRLPQVPALLTRMSRRARPTTTRLRPSIATPPQILRTALWTISRQNNLPKNRAAWQPGFYAGNAEQYVV